jgi:uncharacterized DUF497 family protein
MAITFDPQKAAWTLAERKLRFEDARTVFEGIYYTFEDTRQEYGERRFVSVGRLDGRMVVIGWTPRGKDRHVFTMRKANDREQNKYGPLILD